MQPNISDTTATLDNSVVGMKRFLLELVKLAGQVDDRHAAPVLELQFGDILTKTSLSMNGTDHCLSITAFLPRMEQANYLSRSATPLAAAAALAVGSEVLWHADEGRYVVVHNIPIGDLPDEPSVMNAILDTSDHARAWFSAACASARRSA